VKTKQIFELFVISLLSLYLELVVIRWLSSEIRIFAFFKNVPLMACLFGLGLGMALGTSKRELSKWFPLGLLAISAVILLAKPLNLVHVTFINPLEYYIGSTYSSNVPDTLWHRFLLFFPGLMLLAGVFYVIVFTFMCIGQRLGRLFPEFDSLYGYTINVGASLAGILLFSVVSFFRLEPPVWLLIGAAMMVPFYPKPLQLLCIAASIGLSFVLSSKEVIWSPYYRITVDKVVLQGDGNFPPAHYGYDINVNYGTIEGCYNNSTKFLSTLSPSQAKVTADYYDTPYMVLGDKPRSVLILAAGTGNDVAAALRHGASEVDCVEIDPVIAELGLKLHPEKPYLDPRVHVIVDDARAFLRRTKKKYDLIVFAYLDSHSALSSMSSIRLDNYVYTRECFQDAKKLLKPDGVVSVTFYFMRWWQLARVYRVLEEGTGLKPEGVFSPKENGPTLLVGLKPEENLIANSGLKQFSIDSAAKQWGFNRAEWETVVPTTDDWPFLFLRDRGWSWSYAIGILFTLFLGFRLIGACFGKFATNAMGLVMFFMGAAFMLLETKSVTQMALLLGTTWLVNSAVISGVLIMILLANLIQMKTKLANFNILFAGLFLSLLLNAVFPLETLNQLDIMGRSVCGVAILSLPLFFAAFIFAMAFSKVEDPGKALGMNLLGTLVGGALEYASMAFGINSLNMIAVVLYALAFWQLSKSTRPVPALSSPAAPTE
jgi:hypothetical protein